MLLFVGIERRGVILAKRLQAEIERIEGIRIECESLNVAMYRDDSDARKKGGNHVRLIQWRKQSFSWMMFLHRSYYSCSFKCIDDIW